MHLRVHMTSHEPDAEAAREQNAALRELEAEERALAEAAREYNAARTLRVGENHAAREAQSDQHRGRARGPAPRQWSLRRLHTTKGWTRYTDPASGHEYLYNDTTGESRWVEDAAPRGQQAVPPAGRLVTQMGRHTKRWPCVFGCVFFTVLIGIIKLSICGWQPAYNDHAQKTWASGDCRVVDSKLKKKKIEGPDGDSTYYQSFYLVRLKDHTLGRVSWWCSSRWYLGWCLCWRLLWHFCGGCGCRHGWKV